MSTILLLILIFLVGLLLHALVLWGIARLYAVESASLPRALLAVFIIALTETGVLIGFAALPRAQAVSAALLRQGIQLGIACLLTWGIIVLVFRIRAGAGALIGLTTSVASGVLSIGVYVGLLQLVQAFVISSNSMAPTLVGSHFLATCPHCQGPAVVSAGRLEEGMPPLPADDVQNGICMRCLKIAEYRNIPTTVHGPDRFICSKFLQADRWDLIVFRYPHDPEKRYVQRLVGLPGERIQIKEKAVWINGVKAVLPAEIQALEYQPQVIMDLNGGRSEWVLGPEEYFVLGDFTTNASDSRDWGPVPKQNFEGVATLIYWPAARWRILR